MPKLWLGAPGPACQLQRDAVKAQSAKRIFGRRRHTARASFLPHLPDQDNQKGTIVLGAIRRTVGHNF